MLSSLRISKPFSEAEINHVQQMLFFVNAYQKVIRLHVSVQEMVVMQELYSLNHLVTQHQDSLEGELSLAESHEVFQARTQ